MFETAIGPSVGKLEQAILARAHRRGLNARLEGMRYANSYVYGKAAPAKEALYVGVGHGLDALLALTDDQARQVVGVDPYVSSHGNDDEDYRALCALVTEYSLQDRFQLIRSTIEDYRPATGVAPDLIIINDVLHHIYETRESLRASELFPAAVSMFSRLREISAPEARLVIGDVSRSGLRPHLGRRGLMHAWIDFATKQNWREWDAAARQAGWTRKAIRNYLPYRLRHFKSVCRGPVPRYSVCDKYYLYYQS